MGWGCRLQGRMMRQTKKIQMTEENWLHREKESGPMCPSVQPPANSLESELFLEQNYCSVTSQTAGSPPATLINNQ